MKDENTSFFDRKTLLAVVLVAGTFMAWQTYMQKKYPQLYTPKPAQTQAVESPVNTPASPTDAKITQTQAPPPEGSPQSGSVQPETLTEYESANLRFNISSKGMGLKNIEVLKYKDRKGEVVTLGFREDEKFLPFATRPLGQSEPLDFKIEKISGNVFVGRAQRGGVQITKTMEIDPERYLIEYKVSANGQDDRFIGLTTVVSEEVEPVHSSSFLVPQFERQEFYINAADTQERVHIDKEDLEKSWSKVKLASVGSQYFTQAVLDKSSIMPEAKGRLNHKDQVADVLLQYPVLNQGQPFELAYTAFLGPKSHKLLSQINGDLAMVVDFGFFNWIGRHILALLNWIYSLLGNWGIAIIGLTILVRILVLPFNIYSYKSMRAMQVIQPKIQALRERYKDDQQKQQTEIMGLMREHKVNPLGGCLPVLLQFPIFIALYQVLGNSIELYQAPFGLWIHDLSMKDPYYILPVLMGITMFIQQKITPNTMDPAQAKVLLMMPLVFTFFMVSLPSGLTLYMLVGAVFSVLQQMYFMKQTKNAESV